MIKANVHSDDRVYKVEFDATIWFEQASENDLIALIQCDLGGDYPADNVALFFEDANTNIKTLMEYCRHTQNRRNSIGFECYINPDQARFWIKQSSYSHLFDMFA